VFKKDTAWLIEKDPLEGGRQGDLPNKAICGKKIFIQPIMMPYANK